MGNAAFTLTGDDLNNIESQLELTADPQKKLSEEEQSLKQSPDTEPEKPKKLRLLKQIPPNLGTSNNIPASDTTTSDTTYLKQEDFENVELANPAENTFDASSSTEPINYSHTDSSKDIRKDIAKRESNGDPNAISGGNLTGKNLTQMSINEVMKYQGTLAKNKKAAGIYQFIPTTLKRMMLAAGFTGDEKFTREIQDKLAHTQLEELGLDDYQKGNTSLSSFAKKVAGTWAAFPLLEDTIIDDKFGHRELKRGDSYYKGVGGNKANVSPEEFEAMLVKSEGSKGEKDLDYEVDESKLSDNQKAKLNQLFSTNTSPTQSGGVHSGFERDEDYDGNANPMTTDINKQRAIKQSNWKKAGSALARVVVNTPLAVGSYLASMADIEDYANRDDEVGNVVTNFLEEKKAEFNKNYAPIYKESNEHLAGDDFGWWMENGASLVESMGAFAIVGAMTGGTAGWLNTIAKGGKWGQKLASLGTSVALNQAESITSAGQVYKKTYDNALAKGMSVEKARISAAEAGAYTVKLNKANILLNYTSANMFVKANVGLNGTGQGLIRGLSKKTTGKKVVLESGQEFAEEEVNLLSEEAGMALGEGRKYGMAEATKDVISMKGLEVGLLGAVGGAGQTC